MTHVRQFDSSDCGPACLLAVLRYHGGDASLSAVRAAARTDIEGTTLADLADAADSLGFAATGAQGAFDDLLVERLPCIAHVRLPTEASHYVVVYHADECGVVVGDPASRVVFRSRAEFEAQWQSCTVLLLSPDGRLRRHPQVAPLAWLRGQLRDSSVLLTQAVFVGVVYAVLGLALAKGVQHLVDVVIPGRRIGDVWTVAAALLGAQAARAALGYVRASFLAEGSKRTAASVARDFFVRILDLPPTFFDSKTRGDFTSRLQDVFQLQSATVRLFGSMVIDACALVGALAYLAVIDRHIAAGVAAALASMAAAFAFAARRFGELQRVSAHLYGRVETQFLDTVIGAQEIIAYGAGERFSRANITAFDRFQELQVTMARRQAQVVQAAELAGSAIVLGVLIIGALRVISDGLTLGVLMASYSLVAQALPAMLRLVDGTLALQSAELSARRILDVAAANDGPGGGADRGERLHARRLVLRRVSYSWRAGEPLLRPTSLELRAPDLTVLTGASGSGKSTLASVIARRLASATGEIRLGDVLADALSDAEYRREVIVVREDVKLFNGTLAANVTLNGPVGERTAVPLGGPDAPFRNYMGRFVNGGATYVGERGRRLSAGERQVIGLMRALHAGPSVLIADECLNALDSEMLDEALCALRSYARDHVVLLISHHPVVIASADRHLVLAGGEVADATRRHPILKVPAPLVSRGHA